MRRIFLSTIFPVSLLHVSHLRLFCQFRGLSRTMRCNICGFVSRIGSSDLMHVVLGVVGRTTKVGMCVTRSIDNVFGMLCSSIVAAFCWTLTMRIGPIVRCCKLLCFRFAKASAANFEAATKAGLSRNTCCPKMNDGIPRTRRSWSDFYRIWLFHICVTTLIWSVARRASIWRCICCGFWCGLTVRRGRCFVHGWWLWWTTN